MDTTKLTHLKGNEVFQPWQLIAFIPEGMIALVVARNPNIGKPYNISIWQPLLKGILVVSRVRSFKTQITIGAQSFRPTQAYAKV